MILTQEVSQAAENVICLKRKTTLIQSPNKNFQEKKKLYFVIFLRKAIY